MNNYYKQPEYYPNFRCAGGECPQTCCYNWNIYWYEDEVEKLKNAEMSDDLRNNIEQCIVPDEKYTEGRRYIVKLCGNGRCPLQNNETDLCDIQKELGAEYLGKTCLFYPRRVFRVADNVILRSCSSSCPVVLEQLLDRPDAGRIDTVVAKDFENESTRAGIDTGADINISPYLKHRGHLIDLINDIIFGKMSFEDSVIFGAYAAYKVSGSSDIDKDITFIIRDLKKQLSKPEKAEILKDASEVEAVPDIKLGFVVALLKFFNSNRHSGSLLDFSALMNGDKPDCGKYEKGLEAFRNSVRDPDGAFKNLAMNMFLDTFVHINLRKFTFFEYYSYYIVCLSSIVFCAALAGYKGNDIKRDFTVYAASVNRSISHNLKDAKNIINILKTSGFSTPVELAMLIK